MLRSLLMLVALSTSLLAGAPEAVIVGQNKAFVGDLVKLSSEGSVGDKFTWVAPADLPSSSTVICGNQFIFSTRNPGTYNILLIASDKDADVAYRYAAVSIVSENSTTPPVAEPGKPPVQPPVTPPVDKFAAIKLLARTQTRLVNDPPTAKAIATALTNVLPLVLQQEKLETAQAIVGGAIEGAMALRSKESLKKDWLNIWRIPIAQAIVKESPSSPNEYVALLNILIAILEEPISLSTSLKPPAPPQCIDCLPK
jgi:hypothetical protein